MGILPRDFDGSIDWFIVLLVTIAVVFVLIIALLMTPGIGTPRDTSEYTGYVVDTEYEKGFIFANTKVHLKTNPRSSEHETFCVAVPADEAQFRELQDAAVNQQRVTVTYERGIYEDPFDCFYDDSMVVDIQVHNDTASS